MDWNALSQHGLTSAITAVLAFAGSYARFKMRLSTAEKGVKEQKAALEAVKRGWRFEFDAYKAEQEQEKEHQAELLAARKEERASRPDPFEAFNDQLRSMRADIDRLKERGSRYVRNEAFAAFVKSQEEQWRAIERSMGQLEGVLRNRL